MKKIIDDEEDFDNESSMYSGQNGNMNSNKVSRDEKRRLSHTAAEQKRRNAIKVNRSL